MEATNWFPEDTDVDYGFMHQYRQVSYLPDFTSQNMEVVPDHHDDELHRSFSSESYSSSPPPARILSFSTSSPPECDPRLMIYGKLKEEVASPTSTFQFQTSTVSNVPDVKVNECQRNKRPYSSLTKGNSMEDHVMAERKRREKLNQRLIALSAVIPGLKKMDKATILSEAIRHVKELQERVDVLEEQTKKRTMESVVLVKKSRVNSSNEVVTSSNSGESCLSDEAFETDEQSTGSRLPEVEVRISGKDVLIRIHCEKEKGILSNILNEIESLHLTVINSNVVQFGNSILDITVISQVENEFSMSIKDLVNHVKKAFSKFM